MGWRLALDIVFRLVVIAFMFNQLMINSPQSKINRLHDDGVGLTTQIIDKLARGYRYPVEK